MLLWIWFYDTQLKMYVKCKSNASQMYGKRMTNVGECVPNIFQMYVGMYVKCMPNVCQIYVKCMWNVWQTYAKYMSNGYQMYGKCNSNVW